MYGTFWRSLKAAVPAAALMVATVAVVVVGTIVPATAAVHVRRPCRPPSARRWWPGASVPHPVRFMMVGDSLAVTMAIGLEVKSVSRFGVGINHETPWLRPRRPEGHRRQPIA